MTLPAPQPPRPVVGRLAPSPTGLLHLGHARSFLLAWWSARAQGGRILLRMEDLDRPRVKPGMDDATLRDLAWLGLDWDGPVVRQSERADVYAEALERLARAAATYPCVCTRAEVERAQSAPHAEDGTARYPGTCRGRFADAEDAQRRTGRAPAVRFLVADGPVTFVDRVEGQVRDDVEGTVGDFPVARRDGEPAYQLAVVVDDGAQGVTEVVRARDLLPSTARQWLLQRALGLPHPTWAHVALVTDEAGQRLAKRHDALALERLREAGVDPRRIVAWAARSAGLECGDRPTAEEVLAAFRFPESDRGPIRVDGATLDGLGYAPPAGDPPTEPRAPRG